MSDSNCLVNYQPQLVYDYQRVLGKSPQGLISMLLLDHIPNTKMVMFTDMDGHRPNTWFVGRRDCLETRTGFVGPFSVKEATIVHLMLLLADEGLLPAVK